MKSHEPFVAHVRLTRSFSELANLAEFLRRAAGQAGLDEESEYGAQLVAEELFTNLVKYGADGDPEVTVRLTMEGERLTMVFEDPGSRAFDPTLTTPRDLNLPTEQRRPGGLGVHLVRTYMDEFRFEHRGGTGFTTVSRKMRPRNA